jgi:transcriptional regulator with GAF, ATPase, and Fis domain
MSSTDVHIEDEGPGRPGGAEGTLRSPRPGIEYGGKAPGGEPTFSFRDPVEREGDVGLIGENFGFAQAISDATQVAATGSVVLLSGETGTGKERFARYIHARSRRARKPLVTANLAAMPVTLLETELFGREQGAYTGALSRQVGRLEAADGGTLFLDEIGELPEGAQARLLRALESRAMLRLGGNATIEIDVRIIASTRRDLAPAVRAGTFRGDLFQRLSVFPIRIPPLRERRDDIPLLVWAFIEEFGERMGKPIEHVRPADMDSLVAYDWPGNVRELRNVVERAMILSEPPVLRLPGPGATGEEGGRSLKLDDVIRRHVEAVLERVDGRIRGRGGAAELLGVNPSTLYSRMKRLQIRRP